MKAKSDLLTAARQKPADSTPPRVGRRATVRMPATERREQILGKAFLATVRDPDFLADAGKAKLDVNPLDGAELEKNVKEVFNLDPKLIPRAKEILK